MRHLVIPIVLLAVAAAPAAAAQKRGGASVDRSRHLWATVNICDTAKSPDTIGIRASMPGSGRRNERMFMRFRVQLRTAQGAWRDLQADSADSGFVSVGAARYKARQSGWSFPFTLDAGQRYELRGVVNYEWRRGELVVRRSTKATTRGHKTALSQPKGYSAASCVLKG
jgi:Ni/Co efflux regulator RcnB